VCGYVIEISQDSEPVVQNSIYHLTWCRSNLVCALYYNTNYAVVWFKELNPRRRVYVEIPKPSRVLVSQHSKMPPSKKLCFVITGELPRPFALRTRLMHFPFEIIIWDTKVF
jgi:hypothetical protein